MTRILLTGASGFLGAQLARRLAARPDIELYSGFCHNPPPFGHPCRFDLTDPAQVRALARQLQPDLVIHTAYRNDPANMEPVIVAGTTHLAQACAATRFLFISSDFVFDGNHGPYGEDDIPRPDTPYGACKLRAEQAVAAACPNHVIIRSSLISSHDPIPPRWQNELKKLRAGQIVTYYTNEIRNPIHVDDLCAGIIAAAFSDFRGLLHISGPRYLSRFEELAILVRWLGIDPALIAGNLSDGKNRPLNCSLKIDRFRTLFPEIHLRDPADLLHQPHPSA